MTDPGFEARFAPLLAQLTDPAARFDGARMRDDLLSLVPLLPGPAEAARLWRELAVLEAKRDEPDALDHADRALAAQAEGGGLPDDRLLAMHVAVADAGAAWKWGPRVRPHLERAEALCATLDRPQGEALRIRYLRAIYERGAGDPRQGLDWFEPLLAEAEAHYGPDSPELCDLLGNMAQSHTRLGNPVEALALVERAYALRDFTRAPARRASALVTLAKARLAADDPDGARQALDTAEADALARHATSDQRYLRDARQRLFPDGQG